MQSLYPAHDVSVTFMCLQVLLEVLQCLSFSMLWSLSTSSETLTCRVSRICFLRSGVSQKCHFNPSYGLWHNGAAKKFLGLNPAVHSYRYRLQPHCDWDKRKKMDASTLSLQRPVVSKPPFCVLHWYSVFFSQLKRFDSLQHQPLWV